MSSKKREQGFSLLEVLVAFMVLALTLTIIMQIFSGGLRNIGRSDDYTRAVLLAESKLTELAASSLEPKELSGAAENFRWAGAISVAGEEALGAPPPVEVNNPVDLYKIQVNVSWGEAEKARQITLNTLRLGAKK